MNLRHYREMLCIPLMLIAIANNGQDQGEEEANAALFLEEYTDAFQEKFFEALKQKGIENYDRAIHLLLECKAIDPENRVVDHELAKAYAGDKKYVLAEEHSILALRSEPENLWYLNTLMEMLNRQGKPFAAIESSIPHAHSKLKENLALIYFKQQNYENALIVLKGIKKSDFTEDLLSKVKTAMQIDRELATNAEPVTGVGKLEENPIVSYQNRLTKLMDGLDFTTLQRVSFEALESYPVHPFFYYANGLALNRAAKYGNAIEVLENALAYWLEDEELLSKIYQELATAHEALGNTSKANAYRNKVKRGS